MVVNGISSRGTLVLTDFKSEESQVLVVEVLTEWLFWSLLLFLLGLKLRT